MNSEHSFHTSPTYLSTGVIIEDGAKVGNNVSIGPYTIVHANVEIEDNVSIGAHCVLGEVPSRTSNMRQSSPILGALFISANTRIGNHVVLYVGTTVESNVYFGDYASVRENVRIGQSSIIGRHATIELNTSIGSKCVVQTMAYVTADTTIEDDVFIGPCVSMSNDKYMGLTKDPMRGPVIRSGARIGNNASLLPGVEIGTHSIVGAGSVVTKDVSPNSTVIGVPAKKLPKKQDEGGEYHD